MLARIKQVAPLVLALSLAAGTGYLTSVALGIGKQAPTETVTVNIPAGQTGAVGPPGPPGPKGEAGSPGAESCPTGSTFKAVLLNAPGGQVTLWTCVKN